MQSSQLSDEIPTLPTTVPLLEYFFISVISNLSAPCLLSSPRGASFFCCARTIFAPSSTAFLPILFPILPRLFKSFTSSSKDRLIYKNEAYDIIYVNNVQEANNYYEIKAKKVN